MFGLKLSQTIGALALIVGFCFITALDDYETGAVVMLIGAIIYGLSRLMIWLRS